MSWHPNDLVTDADLLAYEPTLQPQFGRVEWADKRTKALEDWLSPALVARGYDPARLRTRVVPTRVLGFNGTSYTDLSDAAASETAEDVSLGSVLSGTSTALLVGHTAQFRGLSVRVTDTPSTASATASVALWEDAWTPLVVADRTQATAGQSFSRGGALTWKTPAGWVVRSLNGSDPLYWARLTVSAALTAGAKAGQIAVIRRSLFCAPVTYKTLAWIFRTALTSTDGPWEQKAAFYDDAAELALQRALDHAGGEFDTQAEDDVIDAAEAVQTVEEAGASGSWTLERG